MTAVSDVSEYLAVYLGGPRTVPGIGLEHGKKPTSSIARYKSPHGSVRYVWYEHGVPFAALQAVTRDGKHAVIANVYTVPSHRDGGQPHSLREHAATSRRSSTLERPISAAARAWGEKLG